MTRATWPKKARPVKSKYARRRLRKDRKARERKNGGRQEPTWKRNLPDH